MDVALDPDFATNHYYYVFYTHGHAEQRPPVPLHRQRHARPERCAGSEVILYQDPAGRQHGAPRRGGRTSATTASSTSRPASTSTPANAQILTNPRGKIHRINPDGTRPTDNPFYDGAGPNWDSIWAYGLRNPFRAYYDAPTGRLYVADVGGNNYSTAYEEVNLGARGRQLRLAELRVGTCGNPCTEPALRLSAQRPRRFHHRRVRLPRHAVPGGLPGQLLLRRLHAELDQAPDVRRAAGT